MVEITRLDPEPADAELTVTALRKLDAALDLNATVRLNLEHETSEVKIPRAAIAALAQVLANFANGEGVTIVPAHGELTTQQAADILHVSRPFLIELLEAGHIDYRNVGTHRRVKTGSLLRYLQEDDARRQAAADSLAAETRKLGFT